MNAEVNICLLQDKVTGAIAKKVFYRNRFFFNMCFEEHSDPVDNAAFSAPRTINSKL